MPLSYASILGGCCTLIGTSTNILVNGTLRDMGIKLFQGYLFAKPGLETLPVVSTDVWDSLE